jgi:hypothetical protein
VVADGVLGVGFGVEVEDGVGLGAAGLELGDEVVEVVGDVVEFLGADDEVEVGEGVEEFGAAVLGHAAEDADEEARVAAFAAEEVAGFAEGFLFGEVADGAGVEEDDVGVGFVGDDGVAAEAEHGGDGLGVAGVHLAAVGFEVDAVHGKKVIQCLVF